MQVPCAVVLHDPIEDTETTSEKVTANFTPHPLMKICISFKSLLTQNNHSWWRSNVLRCYWTTPLKSG